MANSSGIQERGSGSRAAVDLLIQPRCTVEIDDPDQPVDSALTLVCYPADAEANILCPERPSQEAVAAYGKLSLGAIYFEAIAKGFVLFSKSTLQTLDNSKPGKKHVSFALGAALWDALQGRKEILGATNADRATQAVSQLVTVDLSLLMRNDFVFFLEEFCAALLARSAKQALAQAGQHFLASEGNTGVSSTKLRIVLKLSAKGSEVGPVEQAANSNRANQQDALIKARKLASCLLLTRSLVNAPPNLLRPHQFEKLIGNLVYEFQSSSDQSNKAPMTGRAQDKCQIVFESYSGEELQTLGCNLIQAVGNGSSSLPRLIKLSYRPKSALRSQDASEHSRDPGSSLNKAELPELSGLKRVCLVGKGITFDSGGYDLKPSGPMRNMKKDMGGAAAAIGSFFATALLDLPLHLDCYVALAENLVSGDSFRPGDVYRARDGSLVEIDNTDAEGRLVLADALHLAAESQPDWIIDLATLTGAARVALGPDVDAMFSNLSERALLMTSSGIETGDWVWQLPRAGSYLKMLDSSVADYANSSQTGHGGAITAALFLERFVGKIPWTHIDTYMWSDKPHPLTAPESGGTSKCVRLILEALQRFVSQPS